MDTLTAALNICRLIALSRLKQDWWFTGCNSHMLGRRIQKKRCADWKPVNFIFGRTQTWNNDEHYIELCIKFHLLLKHNSFYG